MKKKVFVLMGMVFLFSVGAQEQNWEDLSAQVAAMEARIQVLESFLLGDSERTDFPEENSKRAVDIGDEVTILSVDLTEMSWHDSCAANDYANDYSDWLDFSFLFRNETPKDIKAVKGHVVFMDIFGEEWWRIGITLNEPVAAGDNLAWDGQMDYNFTNDQHKKAKTTPAGDVSTRFVVEQVIYADGSRTDF